MNDYEVRDLYKQVQEMEMRLSALEKGNCKCCEEK